MMRIVRADDQVEEEVVHVLERGFVEEDLDRDLERRRNLVATIRSGRKEKREEENEERREDRNSLMNHLRVWYFTERRWLQ